MVAPLTWASRTSTFSVELLPLTAAAESSICVMIPGALEAAAVSGDTSRAPGP